MKVVYEFVKRREFCPYCGVKNVAAVASRYDSAPRRGVTGFRVCGDCGAEYSLDQYLAPEWKDRIAGLLRGSDSAQEDADGGV